MDDEYKEYTVNDMIKVLSQLPKEYKNLKLVICDDSNCIKLPNISKPVFCNGEIVLGAY